MYIYNVFSEAIEFIQKCARERKKKIYSEIERASEKDSTMKQDSVVMLNMA